MSNTLSSETQALAVSMLCEGSGIRQTARVLDVDPETVMNLGRDVGEGYMLLHQELMVNLNPRRIEIDEAWSFVFKKEGHLRSGDPEEWGSQFCYLAMDAEKKAILAFHAGKRTKPNTFGFMLDLALRLSDGCKPQITTDGFDQYPGAIMAAFGPDVDYAQLVKKYAAECAVDAAIRYQAAEVITTEKRVISGEPTDEEISTAYVERLNLSLRSFSRRFNRLTNGHSKTARNHKAALAMFCGHYNFVREHSTIGKTPACAVGAAWVTWDIERFTSECLRRAPKYKAPVQPGEARYAEYLQKRAEKKPKKKSNWW